MTRIPINLYQHTTQIPGGSILVSRSGRRGDAHHIPRSLVTMPLHRVVCRPVNEPVEQGKFEVDERKLRELGWLQSDDGRQGRLI